MRLEARRWLLAPVRQWRTHRLMRAHGSTLPYATAWSLITLVTRPEEFGYVRMAQQQARHDEGRDALPAICYDDWDQLDVGERARRMAWLRRHHASPIQLLGLSAEELRAADIQVIEWGPVATGVS